MENANMVVKMSVDEIFTECAGFGDGDQDAQLKCVIQRLLDQDAEDEDYTSETFLVYSAALVFFMQAGFALVEQGSCRLKSMQSILMKNVADCIVGGMSWYIFGYGIAFGFGMDLPWRVAEGALSSMDISNYHFQCTFAQAASTIVSGGVAERIPMQGSPDRNF